MGEAFIFIMGLICTGSVVIAAILSINELKDIEEPKLQDYNMSNAAKKSLRFIFVHASLKKKSSSKVAHNS